MSNLKYKDYMGSVEYSEEDGCLHGRVLGISKAVITYEGNTIDELRSDFIAGIEHYISSCQARGVVPEKSYSGNFNIRIPAELHAKIAYLAQSAGVSLNAFIKETLTKAVM